MHHFLRRAAHTLFLTLTLAAVWAAVGLATAAPVPVKKPTEAKPIVSPLAGIWRVTWTGVAGAMEFNLDGSYRHNHGPTEKYAGVWSWTKDKLTVKEARVAADGSKGKVVEWSAVPLAEGVNEWEGTASGGYTNEFHLKLWVEFIPAPKGKPDA